MNILLSGGQWETDVRMTKEREREREGGREREGEYS